MNPATKREALMDAGLRLANHLPFADLGARRIADQAGLTETDFAAEFADLEAYLVALQQLFMEDLKAAVIAATLNHPAGFERAQLGATAYLDGCLARHGLRGWLLQARSQRGGLMTALRRQNQGYLTLLPLEFSALDWPYPKAGARLFLAALWEIARLEHGSARANPDLRGALWQYLRTYDRRGRAS